MTTYATVERVCAVCGHTSDHTGIASTNSFGHRDLDGRPAPMLRDTIRYWVEECPNCGYVAGDISKEPPPDLLPLIRSEEYQWHRKASVCPSPPSANRFLRCAWLAEETNALLDAANWWQKAAWVCDDTNLGGVANECRVSAEALLRRALETGQATEKDRGYFLALRVDLLRRAGEFDRAQALCQEALTDTSLHEMSVRLLHFQSERIAARDSASYTFAVLESGQNGYPQDHRPGCLFSWLRPRRQPPEA